MVECSTRDWEAAGSSLTGVTALCPWTRHIDPRLVLVQPRKTRPYITVRLLMGFKESNQTKRICNSCNLIPIPAVLKLTLYCFLLHLSQQFFIYVGPLFLGWTSTKQGSRCLAQGHNTMTPVRVELTTPQSRDKHSTTKSLRSQLFIVKS